MMATGDGGGDGTRGRATGSVERSAIPSLRGWTIPSIAAAIALAAFGAAAKSDERRGGALDLRSVPADLTVPGLSEGTPAAGERVKETHPDWRTTGVYHVLYLPTDWKPGRRFPVIVELAGNGPYRNAFGDVSTGLVEGSKLGYGISAGEGYLWLCLPYLDAAGEKNVRSWWGTPPEYDARPTVRYAKKTVPWICARYGGDPERVILTGFSRGAIACNFIGLYDDDIARIWRAFVPYSHYDGVAESWPYPGADRNSALERLRRLGNRPQFVLHENSSNRRISLEATRNYLEAAGIELKIRFRTTGFRNHNDAWILRPSPARNELRKWVRHAVAEKADRPRRDRAPEATRRP